MTDFSTLRNNMDRGGTRAGDRVYLDHNATTPLASVVAEHVPEWLQYWGNPSSIHQAGRGPKLILREAREKIARALGASSPLEIIFTSGGSEANSLAIKGVFEAMLKPGARHAFPARRRFLFGAVEHPSLRKAADYVRSRGADVEFIPVGRDGSVSLAAYEAMLDDSVALVSFMLANNETGNVFPIREMARLAHARGALFHSDCVQALGKLPLSLADLGVDLASFSGHKFYSLKGAGLLYARKGVQLESQILGGGQERHRRGGTENVLAIAALGLMSEMIGEVGPRAVCVERLRDHMEERILSEIPRVTITGVESPRLPNTSSLVIEDVDGETLLMNLDMRGFAVSTGAACSSGSPEPSPVLLAMGLKRSQAQSSLRLGLGWSTTLAEVDRFCDTLVAVVAHVRSFKTPERKDEHVHP